MIPSWVPPARVVDVGDGELFARVSDVGGGRPVLLLHGWMATADANFFGLYQALDGRRPVIAPDHRGHGRSFVARHVSIDAMAADAGALLDALGTGPVDVVGYSMGTAVAQVLASTRPDLVSSLVLSGGALRWNDPLQRVLVWRAGWDGTIQRASTGRWLADRLARRAARTSPLAASVAPWVTGELERGHPGNLRDAGRSLARFDGRGLVAGLRDIPCAIVLTAGDHLVAARRQRALVSALGARCVVVDGDHDSPAALAERWSAAVVGVLGATDRHDIAT